MLYKETVAIFMLYKHKHKTLGKNKMKQNVSKKDL